MTWTREHDRIIAEKREGLAEGIWIGYVPDYPTDLPACIRAAEAWRKKNPGNRLFFLTGGLNGAEGAWKAKLYELGEIPAPGGDKYWVAHGPTPSAALAEALYQAVEA